MTDPSRRQPWNLLLALTAALGALGATAWAASVVGGHGNTSLLDALATRLSDDLALGIYEDFRFDATELLVTVLLRDGTVVHKPLTPAELARAEQSFRVLIPRDAEVAGYLIAGVLRRRAPDAQQTARLVALLGRTVTPGTPSPWVTEEASAWWKVNDAAKARAVVGEALTHPTRDGERVEDLPTLIDLAVRNGAEDLVEAALREGDAPCLVADALARVRGPGVPGSLTELTWTTAPPARCAPSDARARVALRRLNRAEAATRLPDAEVSTAVARILAFSNRIDLSPGLSKLLERRPKNAAVRELWERALRGLEDQGPTSHQVRFLVDTHHLPLQPGLDLLCTSALDSWCHAVASMLMADGRQEEARALRTVAASSGPLSNRWEGFGAAQEPDTLDLEHPTLDTGTSDEPLAMSEVLDLPGSAVRDAHLARLARDPDVAAIRALELATEANAPARLRILRVLTRRLLGTDVLEPPLEDTGP